MLVSTVPASHPWGLRWPGVRRPRFRQYRVEHVILVVARADALANVLASDRSALYHPVANRCHLLGDWDGVFRTSQVLASMSSRS